VLVSRNFERLSTRFVVTTPRWEVLSTLMDKRRCYELASSIGLNVPRFFAPSSAEEIKRVFAGLDFQTRLPVHATTHRRANGRLGAGSPPASR
jgi:predicted ATP-grasp superfamily ATP-dependent carboligase